MIIFLAYEGFELIANAAEDVPDAGRTLTAAYYISVGFVIALLLANLLDLQSISVMGSAGFLIIFAVVNAAEAVTSRERGSRRWISVTAAVACLTVLVSRSRVRDVAVLAGMVACAVIGEAAFRRARGGSEVPDGSTEG